MKQAYKSVSGCDLLHDLHHKLVLIGRDIGCRVDGCELVLSGCNLIVLGLCKDSEFPEFFVEVVHKGLYSGLDDSEVMVIHFLTLGRS